MKTKQSRPVVDILLTLLAIGFCAIAVAEPTSQSTVQNEDGSYTYTQIISGESTPPHYTAPSGYGFDEYSWYNEDYGWQHNFDLFDDSRYQILSATMLIRGWDVDSEPVHGTNGEYDGIFVDGEALNPGLLQGTNNTWSETLFNVPLESIADDGLINVWLDIDMNHTSRHWATTLEYSQLVITYLETENNPPLQPELSFSPAQGVSVNDDLVVTVTGPTPADPDFDNVTYTYRWFVDVGQGYYVDDEFAGKDNHTGNTVPAGQTNEGERWKVEVYPSDSNGIAGPHATVMWYTIGDADNDGVNDSNDAFPLDSERAFINRTPATGYYTLAFEDQWPQQGDYDLNDLVLHYAFSVVTNSQNLVKQIDMDVQLLSRGAARANGFALSLPGTNSANVESQNLTIAGQTQAISAEEGHSSSLVYTLVENLNQTLPAGSGFSFYNTESGDSRSAVPVAFSVSFAQPMLQSVLGAPPYNPFLYATYDRGIEVHLPNKPPTALANQAMFGQSNDNSNPASGRYYMTGGNLPWAIDISGQWKHPFERVDVLQAYPKLQNWAESAGVSFANWYNLPVAGRCWNCQ